MEDAQQSWEEDDYARTPTAAVPIARAASDHVIASSAPPTDHGIARYYSSNHLRGLRSDDEDSKLETGLIRSFGAVLNQPQSEHGNPFDGPAWAGLLPEDGDIQTAHPSIASYMSMSRVDFQDEKHVFFPFQSVWKWIWIAVAFAVGITIYFVPIFAGEDFAHRCCALLGFVAVLWATEAVPLYVTSIIIPLGVVWLEVLPESSDPFYSGGQSSTVALPAKDAASIIAQEFFGDVIMLFLGGFTIAVALDKYGLNRFAATLVLTAIGTRPSVLLFAVMFLTAFLSMWIGNPAAAVVMVSVMLPTMKELGEDSRFNRAILLGIAFAGNIGGMTTPVASPQNAIALSTLSEYADKSINFLEWLAVSLPLCSLGLIACWGCVWVVTLPSLTILMWMMEGQTESFTGNIGITALIPIILFFGCGYLGVSDFDNLPWNILILMCGGLALGFAIEASNLLSIAANWLRNLVDGQSVWVVMLVFSSLVLLMGTFISSTVAAIIVLPVVAEVGNQLHHSRLLVFACCIMCSGAMALPVSSFPNANSFAVSAEGSRKRYLSVADYLKGGIPVGLILIGLSQSVVYGVGLALGW